MYRKQSSWNGEVKSQKMSWDDTEQSLWGYEEYVLSTRKYLFPTKVQVQTSAVFSFCGVSWDLASSKAEVMGLVCYRSVRTTSQDEELGRYPVQQPITLIALKIIFRQINMNPVCLEPEGEWRKREPGEESKWKYEVCNILFSSSEHKIFEIQVHLAKRLPAPSGRLSDVGEIWLSS